MRKRENFIINFMIVVGMITATNEIYHMKLSPKINTSEQRYSLNVNGQTYGKVFHEDSEGCEPELISAIGIDGVKGYVYSSDLDGEDPKTPEAALEQSGECKIIHLYAKDGIEVLGEFRMGEE